MNQDTCFSDSPKGGKWCIEINYEKGEERTPAESVTLLQCSHDSECTCDSDRKKFFFKFYQGVTVTIENDNVKSNKN